MKVLIPYSGGVNSVYALWRSKADPKTYTYRGNLQMKALELLGIKL